MHALKYRRFLPAFAAIALFFQALVPFYATYEMPTAAHEQAAGMAKLFGEKILLCTREGFRMVSWDELLAGKEKPHSDPHYKCALCYVAAHGTGVEPRLPVLAEAIPPLPRAVVTIMAAHLRTADLDWRASLTRSPPFSFVG